MKMIDLLSNHLIQLIHISQWRTSKFLYLTRALAIVITICFVFPFMSWAFQTQTYPDDGLAKARLINPQSQSLAAAFQIPPHLGKVIEAGSAAGKFNFILIQDLHCNYEIQSNIRAILNHLLNQHPNIKLIAVEGASGIIPFRELAASPNSGAKYAVTDYFLRAGKLTGADCLALCDPFPVELFGAEDEALYSRSLDLIQEFTTEQNRGLILELLDQLEYLQSQQYNQGLIAFERRRKMFLKGEIAQEIYLRNLIQDAQKLQLDPWPPALRTAQGKRELDYQEREIQKQYLEDQLRSQLVKTDQEKKLYQYQHFLEIVERIINVSAAREDLSAYASERQQVSLRGLANTLQASLGNLYFNWAEEIAGLEKSLDQALQFYQLAERRDQALWQNSLKRLKERNEQSVILITGGYHTPAISEQIRAAGQAYVILRPNLTQTDTASNYFDLLRNANQTTEFEKLLVQSALKRHAIAVRNFLTSFYFRNLYQHKVALAQAVETVLKGEPVPDLPFAARIEKIDSTSGRVVFPNNISYVVSITGKNKLEFVPEQAWQERLRAKTPALTRQLEQARKIFSTPQAQVITLALAAFTMALATLSLTGVIALPITALLSLSLILFLTWWSFSQPEKLFQGMVNHKSILLFSMLAGMILLGPILGETIGVFIGNLTGNLHISERVASVWQGINIVTAFLLSLLPAWARQLAPQPHKIKDAAELVTNLAAGLKGTLNHPIFDLPLWVIAWGGMVYTNRAATDEELWAAIDTEEILERIEQRDGIPYHKGEMRPDNTHEVIIESENEQEIRQALSGDILRLPNFEQVLAFTYLKEPEGRTYILAPLKTTRLEARYGLLIRTADRLPSGDPRRIELEKIIAAVTPQAGERIALPQDNDMVFAPRVMVIDLLKTSRTKYKIILHDMDPNALRQDFKTIWEELFEEIPQDAKNNRQLIRGMMDEALQNSRQNQPEPTQELFEEYDRDGVWHEISHNLALKLPKEMELEFFNLIMRMPKGRIFFKNMVKALNGIRRYRQQKLKEAEELELDGDLEEAERLRKEYGQPTQRTKNLAMAMFGSEMFADLFAIFLKAKIGQTHVYTKVYRENLTPELQAFFEKSLSIVQKLDAKRKTCVSEDSELRRSRMYQAQKVFAALGIVIDLVSLQPIAGRRMPWNISFVNFFRQITASIFYFVQKLIGGRYAKMRTEKAIEALSQELFGEELLETEPSEESASITTAVKTKPAVRAETSQTQAPQEKFADLLGEEEQAAKPPITNVAVEQEPSEDFADLFGGDNVSQAPMPAPNNQRVVAEAAIGIKQETGSETDVADLFGETGIERDKKAKEKEDRGTGAAGLGIMQPEIPSTVAVAQEKPVQLSDQFTQVLGTGESTKARPIVKKVETTVTSERDISPAPLAGQKGRNLSPTGVANEPFVLGLGLSLPPDMQTQLLSPERTRLILQRVQSRLAGLGPEEHLNIGFDNPEMASDFKEVLAQISALGKEGQEFARRVQVDVFARDGYTGKYKPSISDWGPQNGIAILTNQITPNHPVTLGVSANGKIMVEQRVAAIPMADAEQYFIGSAHNQLWANHQALLQSAAEPQSLSGQFLLDLEHMSSADHELVKNYKTESGDYPSIILRQDIVNTALQSLAKIILAAVQPAFQTGVRQVKVEFNPLAWQEMQHLSAMDNISTMFFDTSPYGVVASDGVTFDLNSAFLNEAFKGKQVENAGAQLVQMLQEEMVVEESEGERQSRLEKLLPAVKAYLRQTQGEEAAEKLTLQQLSAMVDGLAYVDQVIEIEAVRPVTTARLHGQNWVEPNLFLTDPVAAYFKIGRMPMQKPVVKIDVKEVVVQPTQHAQAKGFKKIFSALLLGYAFGALLLSVLTNIVRLKDKRGQRIPLGQFFRYPNFIQAIRIMLMIVMGQANAMELLSALVRQQIYDLQMLIQYLQQQGRDIDQLSPAEIPASLQFSLRQFIRFKNFLINNFLFKLLMRLVNVNPQEFITLYPELYALVNQGDALQSILWYFAPAETFEREVRRYAEGFDPQLRDNLTRPVATANAELNAKRLELAKVLSVPSPDQQQIERLESEILDRVSTLVLQRALQHLRADSGRVANLRLVMRVLIRELGRDDVAHPAEYQAGLLKVLSIIEPFHARPVYVRLASGQIVLAALPNSLVDSTLRDQMLLMLDVFDSVGEPLTPLRRKLIRAGAMA